MRRIILLSGLCLFISLWLAFASDPGTGDWPSVASNSVAAATKRVNASIALSKVENSRIHSSVRVKPTSVFNIAVKSHADTTRPYAW